MDTADDARTGAPRNFPLPQRGMYAAIRAVDRGRAKNQAPPAPRRSSALPPRGAGPRSSFGCTGFLHRRQLVAVDTGRRNIDDPPRIQVLDQSPATSVLRLGRGGMQWIKTARRGKCGKQDARSRFISASSRPARSRSSKRPMSRHPGEDALAAAREARAASRLPVNPSPRIITLPRYTSLEC